MSPAFDEQQDRAEARQLAAGHDPALNQLIERHGQRLFHFLVRALGNESEAADLAEEVFVRVYQNRNRFDPRQKFSTWLYAIATNLVRDRYRWRSRHPEVALPTSGHAPDWIERLPDAKPAPDEQLAETERAALVRKAIGALPEEWRTALILYEYEELSHAEIGEVLGCSAKAVETRLYRARQQLRAQLAEFVP